MEYFYAKQFKDGCWYPDEVESRHMTKVLRKAPGSEILLVNGAGVRVKAQLEQTGRQVVAREISREVIPNDQHVTIAVAPTKNADRMEWMVEKLVEIGIRKLIFIDTRNGERSKMQQRRIHMKALAAMKQSLKTHLPEIEFDIAFSDLLNTTGDEQRALAHCYSDMGSKFAPPQLDNSSELLIAIGPEGDFSKEEVKGAQEAGWQMLDLGTSRLRTETAAIVACTLMQSNIVK